MTEEKSSSAFRRGVFGKSAIALAAVAAAALPLAASAATYYVDNAIACSDSNAGTSQSAPWCTVARAMQQQSSLVGGDSVLFKCGDTWNEQFTLSNIHGTSGNPVILGHYGSNCSVPNKTYSATLPALNGGSVRAHGFYANASGVSYVTIDGFDVHDTTNGGIVFETNPGQMPGVTIENNLVHQVGAGACGGCGTPYDPNDYGNDPGVGFSDWGGGSGQDGVQILNNTVWDTGGHNTVRIHYDSSPNALVSGNLVGPGCFHNCIDTKGITGYVTNNITTCPQSTARGNQCNDPTTGHYNAGLYSENTYYASGAVPHWIGNIGYNIGICAQAGGSASYPERPVYYNNTCYNANGYGLYLPSAQSADIQKNLISGKIAPSGNTTWDYNDDYGASGNPVGPHDINVDPQYMNPSAGNFTPQNSQAISGWSVDTVTPYDYLGAVSGSVSAAFDFSLSNNGNVSVTQGSSVTPTVTATLSSGSTQSVSFSASGIPSGASASFSLVSCSPTCNTTLTITTSSSTPTGSYTITVTGTGGGMTHTTPFTLSVVAPIITLSASASVSPTSGIAPLAVSFAGSASGGTNSYTYSWNFGDGSTGSGQTVSHTYQMAGSYAATLTVTDSASDIATASQTITVSASADTTAPSIPTGISTAAISSSQVNLSWPASTDPDNTASQIGYNVYRNGTKIASTAAGITSYSDTGLAANTTYSYTVSASDPSGNTSVQSGSVSATTQAVTSSLTASGSTATPTSGPYPLAVSFTGVALGGTAPYGYYWNFGDGTATTTQNPTHTYVSQGTYAATLTVADSASATATASWVVTVSTATGNNFYIGERVKTTANLNVRSQHTLKGAILCVQPAGATGTITQGPTGGNSYTWWYVNFDTSCSGWVVQNYLVGVPTASLPSTQTESTAYQSPDIIQTADIAISLKIQELLQEVQTLEQELARMPGK